MNGALRKEAASIGEGWTELIVGPERVPTRVHRTLTGWGPVDELMAGGHDLRGDLLERLCCQRGFQHGADPVEGRCLRETESKVKTFSARRSGRSRVLPATVVIIGKVVGVLRRL